MPILKSEKKGKEISVSAKLPESLKKEIDEYVKFASLQSINEFVVKASEYVLSKDKDWKKHKASNPSDTK